LYWRFNGVSYNPEVFYKSTTGANIPILVVDNPTNPAGHTGSGPMNYIQINDSTDLTYMSLTTQYFYETTTVPEITSETETSIYYREGINPVYQYKCYWTIGQCITTPFGHYEVQYINNQYWTHISGPRYEFKLESLTEIVEVPGGGLPETMQITNSLGAVVDFDFTGIESKLDLLAKDLTLQGVQAALEAQSTTTIEGHLSDLVAATEDLVLRPDLVDQANESNRQLSLIVDQLHYHDDQGVAWNVAQTAGGSSSGGLQIKGPDGEVIDLNDLFDQVIAAIAAGQKLNAAKLEPLRGFLEMLKAHWTA